MMLRFLILSGFLILLSFCLRGQVNSASFAHNVGIGIDPISQNTLLVRSGSPTEDESSISTTVQIQRFAHPGDNVYANPKALRVFSKIYDGVSATEYAVSGELESYTNISSKGNTAVSGTSWKHAKGQIFGGHFQANDETGTNSADPVFGGSIVGAEINLNASKADDYITPSGYPDIRIGIDMPAKTKQAGVNTATYGAGIRIRNSAGGGVWKKGIHVYDDYGSDKGNAMPVGVEITSSGNSSLLINGDATKALEISSTGTKTQVGLLLKGRFDKSAIQIPSGTFISLESTGVIKFRHEISSSGISIVQFYNGDNKIGYLDCTVSGNPKLN